MKLLPIEKEDLPLLQHWRNSDNVMPYCRQYRPLSMQDMENWTLNFSKSLDYNLTNDLFILTHKGLKVGVGGIIRIDWRNSKGELSLYVGEPQENPQAIFSDAISTLVGYAFKTLNLYKIYWPVYSFNPHLPIYERCLKREYVAKEEYYWDGKFHDRVILVAYNDKRHT